MFLLLVPLAKYHIAFNLFRYITFRSAAATLTALLASFLLGPWLIRKLRAMRVGEVIRSDGPQRHHVKAGTPTMGGTLILAALLLSMLLWGNLNNRYVWVAVFATAGLGLIGFLDDWFKLTGRRKGGLRAKEKFGAQILVALVVVGYLYFIPADGFTTKLSLPFAKEWMPNLGWLYIPFAILLIVGASNAVNLTDGLDGLAIGPIIMAGVAFAVIAYVAGHAKLAQYLIIIKVSGAGELAVFCGALVGASIGFLWFNSHPAEVFMGNVGSLALGGALGTVAVLTKTELLLPLIGGIFVIEALSVILQVAWFKLTGKRIFRMAPLHHHFELLGWAESKIIVRFWIISFILALLALTTIKVR